MSVSLLIAVAIVVASLAIQRYLVAQRLPPGTRPLPGPWGRVHDIPSKGSWIKFYEWSKKYGPIYQMKIFGTTHVWITSEEVAHDLLSKRATIYSDRPMIPNLPNNRTSGDYLALLGRSDTWKGQRKLCNYLMLDSDRASLHSYPTYERDRFLYLMYLAPDKYRDWIEEYTSRTVSWLCWGTPEPAQSLRHTTFGLLQTISPSGALPNIMSFLRHIPLWTSPWQKKETTRHVLEDMLFDANVGLSVESDTPDQPRPSFVRTFLAMKQEVDDEVKARWGELGEARHVVGLMAIAGALTIGSPLQSYLLAMCHYPEWQRKLQHEVDCKLRGRCPEWEDRERLPLLRAVVKEVIRWRPPVPTGIPHAIEKDDIYNGFFIPAGATIHALEWGITRNPTMYPDAEDFNPGRWIEPSSPTYREPLTHYPNLAGFSQFGFGRRTCQGIPIVEQDLFMTMGGMAWAFDIRKKRNPVTGAEQGVHWNDYTPLLIAKPTPFEFDAVPRSGVKIACMRRMYEGVLADPYGPRDGRAPSAYLSVSSDDDEKEEEEESYPSSSSFVTDGSEAPHPPEVVRPSLRIQLKNPFQDAKEVQSEDDSSEGDNSESETDYFYLAREFQPITTENLNLITDAAVDKDYFGDTEAMAGDTSADDDSDAESVFDWGFLDKAPNAAGSDADLFSPITEDFPPYPEPECKRDPEAEEWKPDLELEGGLDEAVFDFRPGWMCSGCVRTMCRP